MIIRKLLKLWLLTSLVLAILASLIALIAIMTALIQGKTFELEISELIVLSGFYILMITPMAAFIISVIMFINALFISKRLGMSLTEWLSLPGTQGLKLAIEDARRRRPNDPVVKRISENSHEDASH